MLALYYGSPKKPIGDITYYKVLFLALTELIYVKSITVMCSAEKGPSCLGKQEKEEIVSAWMRDEWCWSRCPFGDA